jgi:DNA-binding NarL/FixJ family response regulator
MSAHEHGEIRVVVTGTMDLQLDGIAALLDARPGLDVEAIVDLETDGPRAVRLKRPDVVLVEVPKADPLAVEAPAKAVRTVHDANPDGGVVAVLHRPDPFAARDVMQNGANACLTKSDRTRHLIDAVYNAARGEQYVSPAISIALADVSVQNGNGDLSLRENEVLRMIAMGFTNQEIADQMHLSVRTIEAHRSRLQAKLGVTRRAELVQAAHEYGLVG